MVELDKITPSIEFLRFLFKLHLCRLRYKIFTYTLVSKLVKLDELRTILFLSTDQCNSERILKPKIIILELQY